MSVHPLPPVGLEALRARHQARAAVAADTADQPLADRDEPDSVRGSVTPRIFTPPLRELTPETSFGFDLIDFAEWIGWPLDPWQQWLAIHMGELLPDGRPRFRTVLVLVARQNGKTIFCRILTLFWQLVQEVPLIVGTSTARETAKESWSAVVDFAQGNEAIRNRYGPKAKRETIGEEAWTSDGCRPACEIDHDHHRSSVYKFAAPNRRAGRSKTVHRAILDELREHQTWDTWNALIKAMTAVPDAQAVAITNQGDALSVVLDSLRTSALDHIETGTGDPRLFLAEWSAPTGSDPTDPHALAQANPDLGNRIKLDSIIGDAIRAQKAGGEELAGFKVETLCMRVAMLDPAIDPDSWTARGIGRDDFPDLAAHRRAVALVLDVALDATHATLYAAARIGDTIYGDVIKAWQGPTCTADLRRELPDLVAAIRPRLFGWFPDGPAAVIAADLRRRRGGRSWAPRGTKVEEIRGDVPAVCMGLGNLVTVGGFAHARDPLVNAHVDRTQKLRRGDVWTFTRAGTEPVDGTYAVAGAVHLARTIRPPRGALQAAPEPDGPPDGD